MDSHAWLYPLLMCTSTGFAVYYYDSMAHNVGDVSRSKISFLLRWLSDESGRVDPAVRFDTAVWEVRMYNGDNVPQQPPESIDCGECVRACLLACCQVRIVHVQSFGLGWGWCGALCCGVMWGEGGPSLMLPSFCCTTSQARDVCYRAGVFMLSFALVIARGNTFTFSQKDMPYLRRLFMVDIATRKKNNTCDCNAADCQCRLA